MSIWETKIGGYILGLITLEHTGVPLPLLQQKVIN